MRGLGFLVVWSVRGGICFVVGCGEVFASGPGSLPWLRKMFGRWRVLGSYTSS